jgi:hypothetical protein
MKLENRDPAATPVTHNSGSMRPTPNGAGPFHDPRSGGQIPVDQYQSGPAVVPPETGRA